MSIYFLIRIDWLISLSALSKADVTVACQAILSATLLIALTHAN